MSVWFVIPSIRPNGGTIPLWRAQGYKVAVLRQGEPIDVEMQIPTGEYLGWAPSVNLLAKWVVEHDQHAEWIVTGGDDYEPDMSKPPEWIAKECKSYFRCVKRQWGGTFGVMQATGDRWGDTPQSRSMYGDNRGAYIDRIAGSPWFGREWVQRAYGGNGPMCGEYFHMYGDEELLEVATKLGVYWPRRDLIQLHAHWGRKPGSAPASRSDIPDFLQQVNTPKHWQESKKIFDTRKTAGWPGHEPL